MKNRKEVAEAAGERPLVLMVEDSPHDWKIYGKMLWYNGFDVCYAGDGAEGLRLARQRRPDLILLDLMLPKMDGLELCSRCREERSLEDTPIVMLSAWTREKYSRAALQAGCSTYLEKPINPVDVLHCIESFVGRAPPSGEGRPPELFEEVVESPGPGAVPRLPRISDDPPRSAEGDPFGGAAEPRPSDPPPPGP